MASFPKFQSYLVILPPSNTELSCIIKSVSHLRPEDGFVVKAGSGPAKSHPPHSIAKPMPVAEKLLINKE
jgi:hypothetical protein